MNSMNLSHLLPYQTRSICPENRTGGKGMGARTPLAEGTAKAAARDLGDGWKVNPYLYVEPGEVLTLGEIEGSGVIRPIWLTPTGDWRSQILRIYWDGSDVPAVECPRGDFFACGWGQYAQVSSLAVCVNPGSAFNSYWEMPFRKGARFTLENRSASPSMIKSPIPCSRWRRTRAIFMRSSAGSIRCPISRIIRFWMAFAGEGSMSAPTWPGA